MCLVGLMLASFASPSIAKVTAIVDSTWTSWTNTVYYFARLSGPNAPYTDLKVHVTAVDRYELYINGARVDTKGNDGNWKTVEEYNVVADGKSTDVFVAVKVNNLGIGNGNGLMVDIKAGADWLGTTTMKRRSQYKDNIMTLYPAIWYFFPGDVVAAIGKSDWFNINLAFFDNASKYGLKPVMLGKIGDINYTPDSHIEIVSGYEGDLDVGSTKGGGISLRRIEGENIALYKPSDADRLVDGDLTQGYAYQQDPMGSYKEVDLVDPFKVNKLVLYTGGTNPLDFPRISPRGFAAEISLDNYRFEEMYIINEIGITNADNGGYEYAEVSFPPEMARYVRYRITATRPSGSLPPHIGEMMVYGIGYTYRGEYDSPWLDLGSPTAYKNFEQITWEGDTPSGTQIVVQTRTLPEEKGTPSKWSAEHTERSFAFDSPEPAIKFQYRVKLSTGKVDNTPLFKSLKVSFSKDNQPLVSGSGSIYPNTVPMGVDTSFVYTLSYKLDKGQNIKTVVISVPNYARVDSLTGTVLTKTLIPGDFATDKSTNDSLYVTLNTPITGSGGTGNDVLRIYFRTTLLTNVHEFGAGVMNSTNNDGAGPVKVWENPDYPWIVSTNTITGELLSQVKANPKVLTPNKDGKNDFTVLEFILSKTRTKVKITIFSSEGTLVRTLYDGTLEPSYYTHDNDPGRWDGKNGDGDLVPPGIYVFQVIADTDEGEKVKMGTVVVAY